MSAASCNAAAAIWMSPRGVMLARPHHDSLTHLHPSHSVRISNPLPSHEQPSANDRAPTTRRSHRGRRPASDRVNSEAPATAPTPRRQRPRQLRGASDRANSEAPATAPTPSRRANPEAPATAPTPSRQRPLQLRAAGNRSNSEPPRPETPHYRGATIPHTAQVPQSWQRQITKLVRRQGLDPRRQRTRKTTSACGRLGDSRNARAWALDGTRRAPRRAAVSTMVAMPGLRRSPPCPPGLATPFDSAFGSPFGTVDGSAPAPRDARGASALDRRRAPRCHRPPTSATGNASALDRPRRYLRIFRAVVLLGHAAATLAAPWRSGHGHSDHGNIRGAVFGAARALATFGLRQCARLRRRSALRHSALGPHRRSRCSAAIGAMPERGAVLAMLSAPRRYVQGTALDASASCYHECNTCSLCLAPCGA
jgi:hypothetical protein